MTPYIFLIGFVYSLLGILIFMVVFIDQYADLMTDSKTPLRPLAFSFVFGLAVGLIMTWFYLFHVKKIDLKEIGRDSKLFKWLKGEE